MIKMRAASTRENSKADDFILQDPGRNACVTAELRQDVPYKTTMRAVDSLRSSAGGDEM